MDTWPAVFPPAPLFYSLHKNRGKTQTGKATHTKSPKLYHTPAFTLAWAHEIQGNKKASPSQWKAWCCRLVGNGRREALVIKAEMQKGEKREFKILLRSTLPFLFQEGSMLYCSQISFLCRWCGPRITSPAEQPRASQCQHDWSREECIITGLRGTCQCIPCWGYCDGGGKEKTILREDWKGTLWRKDLGSQSCCLL